MQNTLGFRRRANIASLNADILSANSISRVFHGTYGIHRPRCISQELGNSCVT